MWIGIIANKFFYQTLPFREQYYEPRYKYRIADTYATRADLTLDDPCVNQGSKVVVSTRELDDTQVSYYFLSPILVTVFECKSMI